MPSCNSASNLKDDWWRDPQQFVMITAGGRICSAEITLCWEGKSLFATNVDRVTPY